MKVIKFETADTAGFNALEQKIHNYLTSKHGVNGFRYSASRWADVTEAPVHEGKNCLVIDSNEPRYSLILESLDQSEIDAIVDVEITYE